MPGIDFKSIAAAMTCQEFARFELQIGRNGRAKCPWHDGEHFNLSFMKDGACYCHVCHHGGDVVALAAATWHMSMLDAARRLNDDYRLGVGESGPNDETAQRRRRERQERERQERERQERWLAHCDDFLPAADGYRAAVADLKRFTAADMDTPEGTAALARCVAAKSRLDEVWFDMTGLLDDGRSRLDEYIQSRMGGDEL